MKHTMPDAIDVVTLRQTIGEILDQVYYQGRRLTVTKNGRPVAALVPLDQVREVRAVSTQTLTPRTKRQP
jgi:prevent-host-death family protein